MSFRISKPQQFVPLSSTSSTRVWESLTNSLNGNILAVVIDSSNNVYVGGSFSLINGVAANYVAKWDGTTWSPLGSGLNNQVLTLAIDSNNNLYAGGFFTQAGGIPANYVARWNGTSWSSLSSGTPSYVQTLSADPSNNLYAGGGGYIQRWNGSSWTNLAPSGGVTGTIYTIYKDSNPNGLMFVGGVFSNINGVSMENLSRYDFSTSTWTRMGGASGGTSGGLVDGLVFSMLNTFPNVLTIGGLFTSATDSFSTKTVNYICQYIISSDSLSQVTFNSVTGTNNHVYSIAQNLSKTYFVIGGEFTQSCGVSSLRVSQFINTPIFVVNNLNSTFSDTGIYSVCVDSNNDVIYTGGNASVSRYINQPRFSIFFLRQFSKYRKI